MLPLLSSKHLVKDLASASQCLACSWDTGWAWAWATGWASAGAGAEEEPPPNIDVMPAPKVWPMVEPTATPAAVEAIWPKRPGPWDCCVCGWDMAVGWAGGAAAGAGGAAVVWADLDWVLTGADLLCLGIFFLGMFWYLVKSGDEMVGGIYSGGGGRRAAFGTWRNVAPVTTRRGTFSVARQWQKNVKKNHLCEYYWKVSAWKMSHYHHQDNICWSRAWGGYTSDLRTSSTLRLKSRVAHVTETWLQCMVTGPTRCIHKSINLSNRHSHVIFSFHVNIALSISGGANPSLYIVSKLLRGKTVHSPNRIGPV